MKELDHNTISIVDLGNKRNERKRGTSFNNSNKGNGENLRIRRNVHRKKRNPIILDEDVCNGQEGL